MSTTGWTGAQAPAETPAMPLTAQVMRNRERGAGDTLAVALGRSEAAEARQAREESAGVRDPDEIAAGMITRGLAPGQISELGQRLADAEAELAGELAKIEKGERVTERVRGMLERGQIGGLDASRMLDGDFGDAQRAAQLERRAGRLREQLAESMAMIAPQHARVTDPLEAATSRAHSEFARITRDRMAEAQQGAPSRQARRPFARGGDAVRAETVSCQTCLKMGLSPSVSFEIHHSDADGNPLAAEPEPAESGGQDAGRGEGWPVSYDVSGREITR